MKTIITVVSNKKYQTYPVNRIQRISEKSFLTVALLLFSGIFRHIYTSEKRYCQLFYLLKLTTRINERKLCSTKEIQMTDDSKISLKGFPLFHLFDAKFQRHFS